MSKQYDKKNRKTNSLLTVLTGEGWLRDKPRTLVVGCGDGTEAGVIARHFGGLTDGIDLASQFSFDFGGSAPAVLKIMDAHNLLYGDGTFDFVFSFHALEHMTEPDRVLREINRVLKPGGVFLIGTPNARRLIGYLGSATSIANILKWNVVDWSMRIQGKWSNTAGAHAGFSERELVKMCERAFSTQAKLITREYYTVLYGERTSSVIYGVGLAQFVMPCVYVIGRSKPF